MDDMRTKAILLQAQSQGLI